MTTYRFAARVLRKSDALPRYVVIKPEHLPDRREGFRALIRLGGAGPFERNIRPWGKGADVFFFNLTAPQCRNAGIDTGDRVDIVLEALD